MKGTQGKVTSNGVSTDEEYTRYYMYNEFGVNATAVSIIYNIVELLFKVKVNNCLH